jgi:diguanylate cyclase (GGDEF)-like protein
MPQAPVPLVIFAARQESAEFINRTLRDAGHPVHCKWVRQIDALSDALERNSPQMLLLFADGSDVKTREVAKIRQRMAPMVPLVVVTSEAVEAAITQAMQDGAQDLVSIKHPERLLAVAERELRTFRLERALNDTLQSAAQYKRQLRELLANATDAIAYVKEGIVVETNRAWADLFGHESVETMQGPLMDLFDTNSQAALKGALVACARGHWDSDPLRVTAITAEGGTLALKLVLESAQFENEPAVRLSIAREQSQRKEPEALVENAVHRDPVTGFLHRRRFVEMLTDQLEHRPRNGIRALAYIRPDKFGEIKNEVGTLASEEILIQLAEVLRNHTYENDLYGRFGGNVFTILLERGTLRDIEAWAENVLSTISDHIFEVAKNTISITCTIGLSEVGPGTDRVETLLSDAEKAAERGRKRGGNRVVLEETSDESTRVQRFDEVWVKRIKAALIENRFSLAHLPIASLLGEHRALYETFIRMTDEDGEFVHANEFMPAAARCRLLKTIDRWVIGASLEFCRSRKPDCVFVKLSKDSINDAGLFEWLGKQVEALGVPPEQVCFEVTEEDATQHLKQTKALSERLKSQGFFFAVEHFGIGRDPMRVLEQIPMQYLKIDGSLMQSLGTNQVLQERVRGFVRAAKKNKIETIAERVEDANTMAVLFQLGATYMQGHYVHEPDVVLEDIELQRRVEL